MADSPFEIPQTLRDLSEQNMKQAHAVCEQLTDVVTKTMAAWMSAMPSNPMATDFKHVQDRAVGMAKKNAELALTLADKISSAQSLEEIAALQTQFAQDQMQVTQDLHSLIGKALQNSEPGAMGARMSTTPSNSATAGFKDVRDRAVAIAKMHVSSAQTLEEIVTLQTQFAQDHMQDVVTRTQQLCGLIGEALQKSEPGALGAERGATSNPIATGFKDVQDGAVAMAKKNVSNAQTLEEIVTLQTQFAQDHMQAVITRTQQLYGLIGEALKK